MKPLRFLSSRSLACLGSLLVGHAAVADTVINFGSVNRITGPGDLDLTGDIVFAINFSANDPVLTLNGVAFTPDTSPPVGTSFVGPQNVTPWQTKPEFGSGADNTLEQILEDIRWANTGAGEVIEAHFPVTVGQLYKVQILFSGNHAENRRWDIELEDTLAVDEVTSLGVNVAGVTPAYSVNTAFAYVGNVTATDTTLDVRFVGDVAGSNNEGGDRNPIWQALTVERLGPDSDSDGMADAWETLYFGNLTRNGSGDFDTDTLTDVQEFGFDTKPDLADSDGDTLSDAAELNTHFTKPTVADSDGDGLADGAEVNTHHTDPARADSDLDGLTDGAEVNTHATNPLKADSDLDSYYDGLEVSQGSNPNNAAAFPIFSPEVKAISGGDVGDGLDLDGTFLAAVRFGATGGAGTVSVRDADFVPFDLFAGLTQNAGNQADNWLLPTYASDPAASADDIALGDAVDSIRYGAPIVNITIPGLTVDKPYKVQLLFGEQCCNNRGFDVYIENALVANEFITGPVQGGASAAPARTSAVVAAFVAGDTTLDIRLDFTTITTPGITDSNTIINALTVEELPPLPDTDGDTLPDAWEITNFGNLSQTATGDPDADGLNNSGELAAITDPEVADTDSDGLNDGPEVLTHQTDPQKADTDSDGLTDGAEVNTHSTNPKNPDSDNDGYTDAFEIANGTNPNNAASFPFLSTQASGFTGGDAGEGLDLDGTFLYAINVGTNGAPGQARDANFTDDAVAGATITAVNEIGAWNVPAYGDTPNDDVLEMVIQSIRWSAAPTTVTASLTGLTIGRPYKLQLLFGEQCCNRGFDIFVNGAQILDDFSPRTYQGGINNPSRGAVALHGFIAQSDTLDIELAGAGVTDPLLTDHNPTLSGITLEELPAFADADADGLPDFWEINFFGNLSQTANGDPDADGLTNAVEFQIQSVPNDADSDDDTLNDGVERNTHQTDPKKPDTDGDGLNDGAEVTGGVTDPKDPDSDNDTLSDGAEVTTLQTNPKSIDTDGDGFNDPTEGLNNTSPTDPSIKPGATHVARVLGGDTQAEGLDLDGTFLYAFNVGTPGAAGQVRDANFTDDMQAGITWVAANEIGLWDMVNFGDTQNDNNLEFVFQSIRWNAAPATVTVSLDGLTVGKEYKLQLLFGEQCCAGRGFDLVVEGATVIDDFNTAPIQGGPNHPYAGGAMVHTFVAADTTLDLELNGNTTSFGDKNPILSGVTLEALSASASGAFAMTTITRTPTPPAGATIVLNFKGAPAKRYALDFSTNLITWAEVSDSVITSGSGDGTYTDTVAARTDGVQVYYRARDPVLKPTP